jgi:hypothetical protein
MLHRLRRQIGAGCSGKKFRKFASDGHGATPPFLNGEHRRFYCKHARGHVVLHRNMMDDLVLHVTQVHGVLSVGSFKKPHRVFYLILRRAFTGVGVEVLYRIVGDGPKVLARDIDLTQPYRYSNMGI